MKFKVVYIGNITPKKRCAKAVLRVDAKRLISKADFLVLNYSAYDFGRLDEKEERQKKARTVRTKKEKKPKRVKEPKIRTRVLLGSLSAVLSITLISGAAVILSLFAGYGGSYTPLTVPVFISKSEQAVLSEYTDIFSYEIVYETNPDYPEGVVTSQMPLGGTQRKLYRGETIKIRLTVNRAPDSLTLPRLVGENARDTLLNLKNFGIELEVIEEYSDSVRSGKIISASRPEGASLQKGELLQVYVSLGKKKQVLLMQNLLGLGEIEASAVIRSLGLEVGKITYTASKEPIGSVILQSISANTSVTEGDTVDITISGGLYYQ